MNARAGANTSGSASIAATIHEGTFSSTIITRLSVPVSSTMAMPTEKIITAPRPKPPAVLPAELDATVLSALGAPDAGCNITVAVYNLETKKAETLIMSLEQDPPATVAAAAVALLRSWQGPRGAAAAAGERARRAARGPGAHTEGTLRLVLPAPAAGLRVPVRAHLHRRRTSISPQEADADDSDEADDDDDDDDDDGARTRAAAASAPPAAL